MRHRDAGRGGAADAGADAGDDAEADAGGGERQRLLAAAAEHQRVAALQPHHAVAVARQADQALVDAKLRRAAPAGALADRLQPRLRRQRQDLRRDQRVVQHDIGLGQGARGVQGEQARVAGTGADQPDGARLEGHASHPLACSSASVSAATSPPVAAPRRAMVAQQGEAVGPFRAELGGEPGADARGEAGARAAGGDRQQQIAAPDLGHAVEVAQRRAVLDVHQHALGPRQGGERGRLVVGQAGDPQGAQARPDRAGRAGSRAARARRRGSRLSSGWSENSSGACAPPARSAMQAPQRRRPPAGDRERQGNGVQRDGYHRRASNQRKYVSRDIRTPVLLCPDCNATGNPALAEKHFPQKFKRRRRRK